MHDVQVTKQPRRNAGFFVIRRFFVIFTGISVPLHGMGDSRTARIDERVVQAMLTAGAWACKVAVYTALFNIGIQSHHKAVCGLVIRCSVE